MKTPVKFPTDKNVYILNVPEYEEIIDRGTHYETADGAVVNWGSELHNNEGVVRSHVKYWKAAKLVFDRKNKQ